MTRLSKKLVLKAIEDSMGIYAVIARKCGVARCTITAFFKRNPNMVKYVEQEREKVLDIGEASLFKLVKEGNMNAVKLLLTTKGKGRGYVERQEIEATFGDNEELKKLQKIVKEMENDKSKPNTDSVEAD